MCSHCRLVCRLHLVRAIVLSRESGPFCIPKPQSHLKCCTLSANHPASEFTMQTLSSFLNLCADLQVLLNRLVNSHSAIPIAHINTVWNSLLPALTDPFVIARASSSSYGDLLRSRLACTLARALGLTLALYSKTPTVVDALHALLVALEQCPHIYTKAITDATPGAAFADPIRAMQPSVADAQLVLLAALQQALESLLHLSASPTAIGASATSQIDTSTSVGIGKNNAGRTGTIVASMSPFTQIALRAHGNVTASAVSSTSDTAVSAPEFVSRSERVAAISAAQVAPRLNAVLVSASSVAVVLATMACLQPLAHSRVDDTSAPTDSVSRSLVSPPIGAKVFVPSAAAKDAASALLSAHEFTSIVDFALGWSMDARTPFPHRQAIACMLSRFTFSWRVHTDFALRMLDQLCQHMHSLTLSSSSLTDRVAQILVVTTCFEAIWVGVRHNACACSRPVSAPARIALCNVANTFLAALQHALLTRSNHAASREFDDQEALVASTTLNLIQSIHHPCATCTRSAEQRIMCSTSRELAIATRAPITSICGFLLKLMSPLPQPSLATETYVFARQVLCSLTLVHLQSVHSNHATQFKHPCSLRLTGLAIWDFRLHRRRIACRV